MNIVCYFGISSHSAGEGPCPRKPRLCQEGHGRCLALLAWSFFAAVITLFFVVPPAAASSGVKDPVPTLTPEEIRAPKQPSSDPLVCNKPLELLSELAIGKGKPAPLLVTIHGGSRRNVYHCDRVTIWKLTGKGYQQTRVWESSGGADDLRLVHLDGHTFLHFRMTSPSAGHEWIVDKLLYVAPDHTLHDVAIDRTTRCGKLLPPLNEEESEYGASYTFTERGIRFKRFSIVGGDGPDSERGRVYGGKVVIQGAVKRDSKTGQYRSTFTLSATGCTSSDD